MWHGTTGFFLVCDVCHLLCLSGRLMEADALIHELQLIMDPASQCTASLSFYLYSISSASSNFSTGVCVCIDETYVLQLSTLQSVSQLVEMDDVYCTCR